MLELFQFDGQIPSDLLVDRSSSATLRMNTEKSYEVEACGGGLYDSRATCSYLDGYHPCRRVCIRSAPHKCRGEGGVINHELRCAS